MKPTLRKICIVLALVAIALLELASVSGSTLAYLHTSQSLTNTFTFAENQPPLGDNRTDRVNYYFRNKDGVYRQIQDTGYTNNTWTYRENERVYISSSNTNIKTPPNGFRIAYATVGGDRIEANESFLQPGGNNTQINIYFEPITYTITYDFNGYDEEDITFSETPLPNSYTVYDVIRVPYDAGTMNPVDPNSLGGFIYCLFNGDSIRCQDIPSLEVDGNSLLGWEDQDGVVHRYNNATGSWATDVSNLSSYRNVYSTFTGRLTGDLVLTARWEYEVQQRTINATPAAVDSGAVKEQIAPEVSADADETETGGVEEVQDGNETTE